MQHGYFLPFPESSLETGSWTTANIISPVSGELSGNGKLGNTKMISPVSGELSGNGKLGNTKIISPVSGELSGNGKLGDTKIISPVSGELSGNGNGLNSKETLVMHIKIIESPLTQAQNCLTLR